MFQSDVLDKILNFGRPEQTDVSTMVSTACSSINNQALISPHFFKTFILMIGIYFIIYVFSKEIWGKWFSNKSTRDFLLAVIIFGTLLLWTILGGGSAQAVRSGFSFSYIIHGIILFLSSAYLVYFFIRFKQATKRK